jgi:membrane-associated phospholipid phosphatase
MLRAMQIGAEQHRRPARPAAIKIGGSRWRDRPGSRELGGFGLIYLLYDGARWAFHGQLSTARSNAHAVISLEHSLHIAVEASVQHTFSEPIVTWVLANTYLIAQLAVSPIALVYLYHRAPEIYRPLRNTVALTWVASVPIFALFPVAPPRLAHIGLKDTVTHQAGIALTGHSTMFYNPYAAMPSLHVAVAVSVSAALAVAAKHWFTKALALMWGPVVTLAVIATGNHYVLDVVAGLAVAALSYFSTYAVQHRRQPMLEFTNTPVPEGSLS